MESVDKPAAAPRRSRAARAAVAPQPAPSGDAAPSADVRLRIVPTSPYDVAREGDFVLRRGEAPKRAETALAERLLARPDVVEAVE